MKNQTMERTRERLEDATNAFMAAFNAGDLDAVLGFFTDDAVFEDPRGARHEGKPAIRSAFEPLFSGALGRPRFTDDDFFCDPDAGKVMTSWHLLLEINGVPTSLRGLDLLHFEGDRISRKLSYVKAQTPLYQKQES
ncbi:MAG: DUF4440 domain-containing protein [Rhizobiales bacterium]|nr:DUF4440 domain-containing protein [Hyphomicrobiales bacterium]